MAENVTTPDLARIGSHAVLSHETVWIAIDSLARRNGLTPSGLARRAGLDPTTFNKSKRFAVDGRPRWPSTESISKILAATNSDLTGLFVEDEGLTTPTVTGQIQIPLIGAARANGAEDMNGAADIDAVLQFPRPDEHPVYAFRVSGPSMEPIYRDGDILIVSMSTPPRRGDKVVVQTKDGEVLVKSFKRKTAKQVELSSANPELPDVAIARASVDWIARVIWASQ